MYPTVEKDDKKKK